MLSRSALVVCLLSLGLLIAQDQPRLRPIPDAGKNMKTGPAVGQKIPEFALPDQQGMQRTFVDLKGPNGLMLAFVRSADW